jgi:predicted membrane protein
MKSLAKTAISRGTEGLAVVPLLIGVGLTLVLTVYPLLLAGAQGKANHLAAMLAFWSMSAGYVRGVGFIPAHRALRLLFSSGACLAALIAAVLALVLRYGG